MFDLKKQERVIVIFLIAILAIGSLVAVLKKTCHAAKVDIKSFAAYGTSENERKPVERTNAKSVNVNSASAQDIAKLDGIGESLAARIVDYRTRNGRFRSKDEIVKVRGIGEKLFNRIKDNISIE